MAPKTFNLSNSYDLLGLPKPDNGKSASQLSIKDIGEVGWSLEDLTLDKFKASQALAWPQSNPAAGLIAQLIDIRDEWLSNINVTENYQPVPISQKFKLGTEAVLHPPVSHEPTKLENNLLSVALHFVELAQSTLQKKVIVWKTESGSPDWPAPDFTFSGGAEEAAVVSFIRLKLPKTAEGQKVSELTIERMIGAVITSAMVTAAGCGEKSNQKLLDPKELKIGNAYADIGVTRIADTKGTLEPTIAVGEAKQSIHRPSENQKSDDKADCRAQMAAALHLTMVLLILDYVKKSGMSAKQCLAQDTRVFLPKDHFLYGIYYDEAVVHFYAHVPILHKGKGSGAERRWAFHQFLLAEFNIWEADEDNENNRFAILTRWKLAVALFTVRTHSKRLVGILKEVCEEYKSQ